MTKSKKPLLIIFVTVFIDLLGFGIVVPLLGRYGDRLQVGNWTVGLLMSSFSAMQFLFAPIWGRVSDRVGRRPILIAGLAGSAVFYWLLGYASSAESLMLLFLARIGAGMSGATIGIAQAYIADSTASANRTAGMALIGAAFGLGFTIGPMLGGIALAFDPSQFSPLPGYFAAGLSTLAMLMAIFMLPESLTPESRSAGREWFDYGHFRKALSIPAIGSLIGVGFVAIFAFAQMEGTLSRLTEPVFELTDRKNYYLFAFIGVTLAFAQGFVVRRMSRKMADHNIGLTGIVAMIAGFVGMVVAIEGRSLSTACVSMFIMVHGFAMLNTSTSSLLSRKTSPQEQGGVLGVNQSASALARIFGPLIGNGLCRYGFAAPYGLSTGIMILAGVLMLRARPLLAAVSAVQEPTAA